MCTYLISTWVQVLDAVVDELIKAEKAVIPHNWLSLEIHRTLLQAYGVWAHPTVYALFKRGWLKVGRFRRS